MRRSSSVGMVLVLALISVLALVACNRNSPDISGAGKIEITTLTREHSTPTLPTTSLIEEPTIPSVPPAPGTVTGPIFSSTPSLPEPTSTPVHATLAAAVMLTPAAILPITLGTEMNVVVSSTVSATESVVSWAWAPTSDKLLYLTNSGNLYWCLLDGSDATLLHSYGASAWHSLGHQVSRGDSLILPHEGSEQKQSHMDVIKFVPNQIPTISEVPGPRLLWGLHWWSSDRASGTVVGSYIGGDRFVTLDAGGNIVGDRNIPFIAKAAVQPGGEWLAYTTSPQTTDVALNGSDPGATYLLNLKDGQRRQLTSSSGTSMPGVYNWSPDGKWLVMNGAMDRDTSVTLANLDTKEWLITDAKNMDVPVWFWDVAWSPDSTRLAFSVHLGGCDAEMHGECPPLTSTAYMLDISSHQTRRINEPMSKNQLSQPQWSPDGKTLGFLSFDPKSPDPDASYTSPAIYFVSMK